MSTPRYVQHISGQGARWRVIQDYDYHYAAQSSTNDAEERALFLDLPKSEYALCDPPARWVDVTAECKITETGDMVHVDADGITTHGLTVDECPQYRFRKVQSIWTDEHHGPRWAFIVERQEIP